MKFLFNQGAAWEVHARENIKRHPGKAKFGTSR